MVPPVGMRKPRSPWDAVRAARPVELADVGLDHRTADTAPDPAEDAACVWAVDFELTTIFANEAFSRLVGINRLTLAGQPWFTVLPATSGGALEWLAHSPISRPTAILEIRHLDGARIPVVACRIYGGPGYDKAVLLVTALEHEDITALVEATVCRLRSAPRG
jgi:PAS domain-containing protein